MGRAATGKKNFFSFFLWGLWFHGAWQEEKGALPGREEVQASLPQGADSAVSRALLSPGPLLFGRRRGPDVPGLGVRWGVRLGHTRSRQAMPAKGSVITPLHAPALALELREKHSW